VTADASTSRWGSCPGLDRVQKELGHAFLHDLAGTVIEVTELVRELCFIEGLQLTPLFVSSAAEHSEVRQLARPALPSQIRDVLDEVYHAHHQPHLGVLVVLPTVVVDRTKPAKSISFSSLSALAT